MRIHSQNLNEVGNKVVGSMFWHGRAWLRKSKGFDEILHLEWLFLKKARDWALKATFGYGDSDSGLCLHACVPFVFSVYIVIPHVYHCKESELGIASHHGGLWLYTFTDSMESRSDFPWWKKTHCWRYPWDLKHHLTEILEHKAAHKAQPIWNDKGKRGISEFEERQAAQATVSQTYDYTYTRKNGEVQQRRATVYVERMTHLAKWYPIVPIKRVSTDIWVNFNEEVGEGTGSWKGGTVGCGWSMKPTETPLECLRRMESERKFDR